MDLGVGFRDSGLRACKVSDLSFRALSLRFWIQGLRL